MLAYMSCIQLIHCKYTNYFQICNRPVMAVAYISPSPTLHSVLGAQKQLPACTEIKNWTPVHKRGPQRAPRWGNRTSVHKRGPQHAPSRPGRTGWSAWSRRSPADGAETTAPCFASRRKARRSSERPAEAGTERSDVGRPRAAGVIRGQGPRKKEESAAKGVGANSRPSATPARLPVAPRTSASKRGIAGSKYLARRLAVCGCSCGGLCRALLAAADRLPLWKSSRKITNISHLAGT